MSYLLYPLKRQYIVWTLSVFITILLFGLAFFFPDWKYALGIPALVTLGLSLLGLNDYRQTGRSILRSFPIAAHIRFLLEGIRPEIRQYFIEGDKEGTPFGRDKRSIVYQRAKNQLDKRPFGTQYDVYKEGYEWLNHSMVPKPVVKKPFRVTVGGPYCKQPYSASILNISAMSFGSLSANAIMALNEGAKIGSFAHDTGEGGVSKYHKKHGGDLIWEIGSSYFGCNDGNGNFSRDHFKKNAALDQVKMIEIKLSQGAKPGHGGILPKAKITPEIAEARGIPLNRDCVSPAYHSAFSTPLELIEFISQLRTLSKGKPIGFKLCIGHPWEFAAICKAMIETGVTPDFIVVDGAEGGTGAAPLEFTDHMGMPLREGLSYVHNMLIGLDLREHIKLGASGKIVSGFDMARAMALGADWCNSARAFMFALGCIQSQHCHTDECPVGVATQNPLRTRAIVVERKSKRVTNYQKATVKALAELVASAGLDHPTQFDRDHFAVRTARDQVESLADLFPRIKLGAILEGDALPFFMKAYDMAEANSFLPRESAKIKMVESA
ncbi:MAG: FMN-binding glutamate synthase family protein [bacterium]|nr:FMN-binding glutamate synthase family protein [bacterium]